MSFSSWSSAFAVFLFLGTIGCLELGRRLRARRPKDLDPKTGALDGAVYALLGLLFGFTFYGAAERFLHRRELVSDEVVAVGTAYMRVDLVQKDRQGPMRDAFRSYLGARIDLYADPGNKEATRAALEKVGAARDELWSQVVASLKAPDPANQIALVVPVNQMFDIGDQRVHTTRLHPPRVVYALLTLVSLLSAVLGGYTLTGPRIWLHTLVYATVMAGTVFVTVELEYPRLGLIQIKDADDILIELKNSMNDDYRSAR